jgi:Xaa-Pro aminopeptidase
MAVADRVERLRRRLRAEPDAAAFVVTKTSNVAYLSGVVDVFDEHADVACIVTASEAMLLTTFIYADAARSRISGGPWTVQEVRAGFYEKVADELDDLAAGHEVVAEASVPYGRFRYLSERLKGRVRAYDQWVEDIRVVKDAEEIDRIRRAARLSDRAFEYILGRIEPGRREIDIALDLEVFLRTEGSEGVPFPPIVASGPNAAFPHARSADRFLGAGDVLKLDFGARVDGYCSDMTRTVSVGPAADEIREMHGAVLEANAAGLEAVRSDRRASEIDAAAREVLERRGYGERFGHGLGHGVGLDVHESPRLGPRSEDLVPAGAVVTVEPGVYVEGTGGVRIEDLVVVNDTGCEVLTESPRELLEV